jgi:hypothetical protein
MRRRFSSAIELHCGAISNARLTMLKSFTWYHSAAFAEETSQLRNGLNGIVMAPADISAFFELAAGMGGKR